MILIGNRSLLLIRCIGDVRLLKQEDAYETLDGSLGNYYLFRGDLR